MAILDWRLLANIQTIRHMRCLIILELKLVNQQLRWIEYFTVFRYVSIITS